MRTYHLNQTEEVYEPFKDRCTLQIITPLRLCTCPNPELVVSLEDLSDYCVPAAFKNPELVVSLGHLNGLCVLVASENPEFVASLDLVITIDSAMAHLAGALGKPFWVLLPYAPDWRWMLSREHSHWYPSAALFRQSIPGDWSVPLQKISEKLLSFRRRNT